jgi:hypothetical protein
LLISPFSAIPSWEGLEYQGHIAIFVVLKKIKSLLSGSINIATSEYVLEIEGAEDFSIKDGNNYLTLHQVKYGNFNLEKNDKFCFLISVLQYNAEKGYFHIKQGKTLPNDFVSATYDKIEELIGEYACEVKNVGNVGEGENCIIVEDVTRNHQKGSKYSILKYFLSDLEQEINVDSVKSAVKGIVSELKNYKTKISGDDEFLNDCDCTFVHTYDELFDKSSEAKDASYLLIGEILDILYHNWKVGTSNKDTINYPEFVYGQILIFIKEKINKCHENREENCKISFSEIFCKIKEDYRKELNSIAYQYYMVWKSIQESFEKYPQKETTSCSTQCSLCTDRTTCNLHEQKEKIAKISKEDEIHNFIYRLMLKKPEEGRPNNLPDDDLIHRLLTCLLKDIDNLKIEQNHLIQAKKNEEFYRMTLNSSGEKEELQNQLSNEMKNSKSDRLLIYETDVLITDQLKEDVFLPYGNNTMVFGEKEYLELNNITNDSIEKHKKKYNKPKIMRLIDRATAIRELR